MENQNKTINTSQKSFYLFLCAILGVLLFTIIHRAILLGLIILANNSSNANFYNLNTIDFLSINYGSLIIFVLAGAWYGIWLGLHWYRIVYEDGKGGILRRFTGRPMNNNLHAMKMPVAIHPKKGEYRKEPTKTLKSNVLESKQESTSLEPRTQIFSTDMKLQPRTNPLKEKLKVSAVETLEKVPEPNMKIHERNSVDNWELEDLLNQVSVISKSKPKVAKKKTKSKTTTANKPKPATKKRIVKKKSAKVEESNSENSESNDS